VRRISLEHACPARHEALPQLSWQSRRPQVRSQRNHRRQRIRRLGVELLECQAEQPCRIGEMLFRQQPFVLLEHSRDVRRAWRARTHLVG
jgi:hypothetical protein